MTSVRFKTVFSIVFLLIIVNTIGAAYHDYIKLQNPRLHLHKKFNSEENADYQEIEDTELSSGTAWDNAPQRDVSIVRQTVTEGPPISAILDSNIVWDPHWAENIDDLGQLSAIDFDPDGRIAIFSRCNRIWGLRTFDPLNRFDYRNGPIKYNTVTLFDKSGKKMLRWGKNMFYLPHGLTIDHEGNYWLTDVALHQVFKFNAEDIKKNWDLIKRAESATSDFNVNEYQNRFDKNVLKPSLILGEAFQPGDDSARFCKPTSVAVARNGDFYVADGYCNSRIIKFNKHGDRILQWGKASLPTDSPSKPLSPYAFFVPHSLALAEDQNVIYVADRENGRVMAYNAQNGTFLREYKHPAIGSKIYAVAYARERIYLVNGPDRFTSRSIHVWGFVIDTNTGKLVSQFAPGNQDMRAPHDITVSNDGSEIYAIELDGHKVHRFLQDVTKITSKTNKTANVTLVSRPFHELSPLTDDTFVESSAGQGGTGQLVFSIIISAMIFIGLCLAIAAVVARCQKRGCLLSVRKRAYWDAERRENFKLSSLLETRQGKSFKSLEKRPNTRDFSKLNTEPETSEDERVEDSLVI